MAVHEDGNPKTAMRIRDQTSQRVVEGMIEALDAQHRNVDRQALRINVFAVGDQSRDGAEATGHAGRLRVGTVRQGATDEARIKFKGFPVDVEIGTRELRQ